MCISGSHDFRRWPRMRKPDPSSFGSDEHALSMRSGEAKRIHVYVAEDAVACLGRPLSRARCVAHEVLAILLPSAAQLGVLEWSIRHRNLHCQNTWICENTNNVNSESSSTDTFCREPLGIWRWSLRIPTNGLRRCSQRPFDADPHTTPATWGHSGGPRRISNNALGKRR